MESWQFEQNIDFHYGAIYGFFDMGVTLLFVHTTILGIVWIGTKTISKNINNFTPGWDPQVCEIVKCFGFSGWESEWGGGGGGMRTLWLI